MAGTDRDFEAIRQRFGGTRFEIERHVVMDRAGWLDVGLKPPERKRHLVRLWLRRAKR